MPSASGFVSEMLSTIVQLHLCVANVAAGTRVGAGVISKSTGSPAFPLTSRARRLPGIRMTMVMTMTMTMCMHDIVTNTTTTTTTTTTRPRTP